MMKVTVIVPVYNVDNYLNKCVSSIINQTYPNLEIILVDDGSTDKSGEICDYFQNKDPRIKVIHQKNRGISAARNSGLTLATGEAITFIDSDDYLNDKYLLENAVSIMLNENVDIVSWLWYREFEDETIIELEDHDKIVFGKRNSRDCIDMMFSNETSVVLFSHVWNKLFKRSTIHEKFFKPGFGEDADMVMRIFHQNFSVYFIDSYSYTYVSRPTSVMHLPFNSSYFSYLEDVKEWISIYKDMPIVCNYIKYVYCSLYIDYYYKASKYSIPFSGDHISFINYSRDKSLKYKDRLRFLLFRLFPKMYKKRFIER